MQQHYAVKLALVIGVLAVLIAVLYKVDHKEKYCVDISGGFSPPCTCVGRCIVDV